MIFFSELKHGDVSLTLVKRSDVTDLKNLILSNRAWLRPWEATNPYGANSFDIGGMVSALRRQFRRGEGVPLIIRYQGRAVGQLNVSNIVMGSMGNAMVGYWIEPSVAGLGITPTAVALVSDYLFKVLGLHRVEIDIRPENAASLRIVEKLGFRYEGLKERYIHINGAWRDHYVFALTNEEVPQGVLDRWIRGKVPALKYPPIRSE